MEETVSASGFDFDEVDPRGLKKLLATSVTKIFVYDPTTADRPNSTPEWSELLATFFFHTNYSSKFHDDLTKIKFQSLEDWRAWLLCHEKVGPSSVVPSFKSLCSPQWIHTHTHTHSPSTLRFCTYSPIVGLHCFLAFADVQQSGALQRGR